MSAPSRRRWHPSMLPYVTITERDSNEFKGLLYAAEKARRDGDTTMLDHLAARLTEVSNRFAVSPPPRLNPDGPRAPLVHPVSAPSHLYRLTEAEAAALRRHLDSALSARVPGALRRARKALAPTATVPEPVTPERTTTR